MPLKREFIFNQSNNNIVQLRNGIEELRSDNSYYSRQGDQQQKNILTEGGLISNGLLGFHANESDLAFLIRNICTSREVGNHLRKTYGHKEWKLVQTMLFDANPITSLHTDDIFLDSSVRGCLVGMLISLENMNSFSGGISLFNHSISEIDNLYNPITDSIDLDNISSADDVYEARGQYLDVLKDFVQKSRKISVYLSIGEIVSWSSYIPHESLRGSDDYMVPRRSIAAHFIPSSMEFTCLLGKNATSYAERFRLKSIPIK